MIKDFRKFIMDLQMAINGEVKAAEFYTRLMEIAPNEEAKMFIRLARDDELKHYRMFYQLYVSLTGQQPVVQKPVIRVTTYCEGLKTALKDELEAAELYRDMYLSTTNMRVRDIMFEAMTDEMEHATRFVYLIQQAGCTTFYNHS